VLFLLSTAVVAIRSMESKAKDGAAALVGITPFIALVILSALWVFWSPSDVFTDHPRLLIWTVGLVFAKVSRCVAMRWRAWPDARCAARW
jgi:hypothetical protein